MTDRNLHKSERLEELLVDQATEGLTDIQQRELDGLLDKEFETLQNEFMQTAALVQLGMLARESGSQESMPTELRDKIAAQSVAGKMPAKDAHTHRSTQSQKVTELRPTRNSSPWSLTGWALAAALALLFVVVRNDNVMDEPLNQQRMALLESATDVISVPWSQPEQTEYAQVSGDVVWSDARQEGFMRLSGMPANDPSRAQYQLWIVDPERGEQPVDGGVFDIPANSNTVIIPINAKLAVDKPTVFAITREQPGGVVVSKGPLLVIATTST